jgi:hypothetical protein
MSVRSVAVKPPHWGIRPQPVPASRGRQAPTARARASARAAIVCALALAPARATADGIVPDAPARSQPAHVAPGRFRPSWDLDGTYLWLGPVGAASHLDARWDSTFGGEAAIGVVHEQAPLGVWGAALGVSRWTARGGTRIWLDSIAGTQVLGHMMGVSLGGIVELSELARPRIGGAVGLWGHVGIAPFARLGAVSELGMFAEVGVYVALPVLRR